MVSAADRDEDRTFKVNFTDDGVAQLRERVNDKLKEFMGDYTDDTLVEYVIVLLKNGRGRVEAMNELNVFLGDDSASFVSWLWDHLDSNLDLYIHPKKNYADEVTKIKSVVEDQAEKTESHHLDSEFHKSKSDNLSRNQRRREWKGSVTDDHDLPPLQSSEFDVMHIEEKSHRKDSHARRSPSARSAQNKKRSRHDEQEHSKRQVSQGGIGAPRRLLQFAVRDAVGTLKPSGLLKEPSEKRLRSVVSTSTQDSSFADPPRRIQSIARVPNPMATVIKAVREAAEDVKRVKSARNVFDRLGRDVGISQTTRQAVKNTDTAIEDEEYEEFDQLQEQSQSEYLQRGEFNEDAGNMDIVESETRLASDSSLDNGGYDAVHVLGRGNMDVSQTGPSLGSDVKDPVVSRYSAANIANDVTRAAHNRVSDQPVSAPNSSCNIANIPVNVNTWKAPHYQEHREDSRMDDRQNVPENEMDGSKSGAELMKENNNPVTIGNGNAKLAAYTQKESQKILPPLPGSYTAGRPLEDVDSRTIFVSNVHFAATKDSLSRHFNKFGEVLKVVIVTDAATGQPKGSAYVEFMRKEAADNALSLDGTSFMSRILKVVKRSSAQQEGNPIMGWPRIARGSPYAVRFHRSPFPRGISGAFRPHLHLKPGARSLQWKRDAQATQTASSAQVPGSSFSSPTARGLTYVRTEPKVDGNSGST